MFVAEGIDFVGVAGNSWLFLDQKLILFVRFYWHSIFEFNFGSAFGSNRKEAFLVEDTLKNALPWKDDFFLKAATQNLSGSKKVEMKPAPSKKN